MFKYFCESLYKGHVSVFIFTYDFLRVLSVSVWLCLAFSVSRGATNRPTNQSGFPSNLERATFSLITVIILWMLLALVFENVLLPPSVLLFYLSLIFFPFCSTRARIRRGELASRGSIIAPITVSLRRP